MSSECVFTRPNGEARVLYNGGDGNHWILINTIGTVSNRDGIGVQIHIMSESSLEQWDVVSSAGSYLSSRDKRVHFGLGSNRLLGALRSGAIRRRPVAFRHVRRPDSDS